VPARGAVGPTRTDIPQNGGCGPSGCPEARPGYAAQVRVERDRLLRAGLVVWTAIGAGLLVVAAWMLAGRLAVVVVPLLLALFPAALLAPLVSWLVRRRVPRPLAVALVLVLSVALVAGVIALVVPNFVAQVPDLARSIDDAATRVQGLLRRLPFVAQDATLGELARQAATELAGGLQAAVLTGVDLLTGLVLLLVALALYLEGGPRIVRTGLSALPAGRRADGAELVGLAWGTLSGYVRALFLVALFDATIIGSGLWVLGVPLVLPLAVLIFFGAFVPYVGALLTGLLAVLVAFADRGVGSALAVLALVVVTQQVEGNVLQPLVMGKVVRLSAFTVIVAIGIGATLLGVLGAFLAVPAAAVTARVVTFLRERASGADPGTAAEHAASGPSGEGPSGSPDE
jgi:putative heme transporter